MIFDFLMMHLSRHEYIGYMLSFIFLGGLFLGAGIPFKSRIAFTLATVLLIPALTMTIAVNDHGIGEYGPLAVVLVSIVSFAIITLASTMLSLFVAGNIKDHYDYQKINNPAASPKFKASPKYPG